jgi:hypothetical protein
MLLAMNHLAHVREMARTINAAATNAANAMLSITPTIKILLGSDFIASHHLETATDNLVEIIRTDTEKAVYNLTKQIAFKLKATPDAGTDTPKNYISHFSRNLRLYCNSSEVATWHYTSKTFIEIQEKYDKSQIYSSEVLTEKTLLWSTKRLRQDWFI